MSNPRVNFVLKALHPQEITETDNPNLDDNKEILNYISIISKKSFRKKEQKGDICEMSLSNLMVKEPNRRLLIGRTTRLFWGE